jgi:hypothetical protein
MDKVSAGLSKALRLIGVVVLLLLGTSRRALDAWVAACAPDARVRFAELKVVRDRRIALDLPLLLDGSRIEQSWPVLDSLFRKPALALLVCGPGGAGKTTLACQVGRRALGENGMSPLGGVTCLPLLVDRDLDAAETGDGLVPFLAGSLRASIGVPRISVTLTAALLRSGRIMVIADGLSERNDATRRAFDPGRSDFPIMRLVATSRDTDRGNMSNVLETLAIPPDALYSFIASYVRAISQETKTPNLDEADIHEACAQLKRLLGERLTTPLLAGMWAEEIGRGEKTTASRIQGVAALIDAYVDRLLAPASVGKGQLDDLRLDLVQIATHELGDSFTPGWLTRSQVLSALRERSVENADNRINVLLDSQLIEEDSNNPGLMRVALDPITEHLVARARMEVFADDAEQWRSFQVSLRRRSAPGFVDALRACAEHPVYGRRLPGPVRRWLSETGPDVTAPVMVG